MKFITNEKVEEDAKNGNTSYVNELEELKFLKCTYYPK
jgi:hypothetical protein